MLITTKELLSFFLISNFFFYSNVDHSIINYYIFCIMLANEFALVEWEEEGRPLSVVGRKFINMGMEVEVGEMLRVKTGGGIYNGKVIGIGKESMKLNFIGFFPEFK